MTDIEVLIISAILSAMSSVYGLWCGYKLGCRHGFAVGTMIRIEKHEAGKSREEVA